MTDEKSLNPKEIFSIRTRPAVVPVVCPNCNGRGTVGYAAKACPTCGHTATRGIVFVPAAGSRTEGWEDERNFHSH